MDDGQSLLLSIVSDLEIFFFLVDTEYTSIKYIVTTHFSPTNHLIQGSDLLYRLEYVIIIMKKYNIIKVNHAWNFLDM